MKLLIFVALFPTIFGLNCDFLYTFGSLTSGYRVPDNSKSFKSSDASSTVTCTNPNDKCFAGDFITKSSTGIGFVDLQMCTSEAVKEIKSFKIPVTIDCNQKMPVYYNSSTLEYTYQCCDSTDCKIPDLPETKAQGGAASSIMFSVTILFFSFLITL
uniref:Uncharacterized protein n=1 Tax=Panagrolaimus sp. JU765 TaxID=591449 RepID=A0AC34R2A1_9BILA